MACIAGFIMLFTLLINLIFHFEGTLNFRSILFVMQIGEREREEFNEVVKWISE